MRYYRIDLTRPDGTPYLFKSLNGLPLTSLLPQGPQNPQFGLTNPGALKIEFNIPVTTFAEPGGATWLRVWGLGLEDLRAAPQIGIQLGQNGKPRQNGATVHVYGGMAKGLPLANPKQAGLLLQGMVASAYGNWIDTAQTIDFDIVPTVTPPGPINVPWKWQAGTAIGDAIKNTLATALPGAPVSVSVTPNLTLPYTETGFFTSLTAFAKTLNRITKRILPTGYSGIHLSPSAAGVAAWDNVATSSASNVKAIAFQDMIGQPTWLGGGTLSLTLVLRGDLQLKDVISIPPSAQTVANGQAAIWIQNVDHTSFTGNYVISGLHHYGDSREPSAASWATVATCYPQTKGS